MDAKEKAILFAVALKDVFKDEEDRESQFMGKLEMTEETVTDDFTAMLYGMYVIYREVTGEDADILDFTSILTKLAVIHLLENNKKEDTE